MTAKGVNPPVINGRKAFVYWYARNLTRTLAGLHRQKKAASRIAGSLEKFPLEVPVPDSATILGYIEGLCSTPHRRPGTPEGRTAEEYVAEKFREFGLERVTEDPIDMTVWDASSWRLDVGSGSGPVGIPCHPVVNTGFTGPHGITAPTAYVGSAWLPGLLKKADVRGKIVVADVPFPDFPVGLLIKLLGGGYFLSDPEKSYTVRSKMRMVFVRPNFTGQFLDIDIGDTQIPLEDLRAPWDVYWNAYRRGAKAVVLILSNMPSNSNTHCGPYDRYMKPIPALWVGKYDGLRLRELARRGSPATVVLQGGTRPGVTHNVWGVLPGASERMVVVQSHHDSPFRGATEDGCGVGQVLAQARAWSQVPREKRPRTLLFLCAAAHFHGPALGVYEFVRRHREDLLARTDVAVCLEHLGARQVEERGREMVPTGRLATTWIFTSPNEHLVAGLIKTLKEHGLKRTVSIPTNLFPVPTTDAFPYPFAGVDFLSWIAQPYYLLSAEDTLDKIEVDELGRIARAVTDLIGYLMKMPRRSRPL